MGSTACQYFFNNEDFMKHRIETKGYSVIIYGINTTGIPFYVLKDIIKVTTIGN